MRFFRFRILCWICLAGFVFWAGYNAFIVWFFLKDAPSCSHSSRVVAHGNAGERVELQEEICDYFVHSATGSLRWVSQSGDGETFFEYDGLYPTPQVRWARNGVLLVSAIDIGKIYTQRKTVDGVNIQYRIKK
jgi:hypothetical protein